MQKPRAKHNQPFPTHRTIRRACSRELYRTVKRLKKRIPKAKMKEAENFYIKEVLLHLPFIVENEQNRKKLVDWWDEHVSSFIAELWEVDRHDLSRAFRDAFGG
ncbi:dehydrogenase [Paenibacillus larvae]|uniref:Dehydrogenase n=3 Tax=Paenibacillus larvae TaxID=1464 RepID=V9W769_9BACL|nr:hypothetical protein [Paenibacillus larvae]AHD06871.1 hypothetical protein ERIC2_c31160 [Paenibacillus larvae subsp. larvae DSM 25430]AQR76293.1 dehydrogenase [Paenibacillus larvae subsp. larvae]MCY7477035.1 dehydrogenase [Paenibacillus larvae]MCY7490920.1 dehydrogenase [Paenibacillus larvae]MCY9565318.1 dehydrogenase [Paenibacillus larvae]